MTFLNKELVMPGEWVPIAQKILCQDETIMVLGKMDSGKTSFIQLFVQYLVKRNRKIGWIDADIGQSTLGPPTTAGMSILDKKSLKSMVLPEIRLVFIGALSPARCVDKFINGICLLNGIGHSYKVNTILIDTTGLVTGTLGSYIKSSLIKRIKPTVLIALQFKDELEPILKEFEKEALISIFRLKPYQEIHHKNWFERKNRRKNQFREYFP